MTDDKTPHTRRRPYYHYEKIIAHLQMIQKVLDRFAACSFAVKGFSLVFMLVGLVTLVEIAEDPLFLLAVEIPVLMMWWLDGFYLRQERLFRKLYDSVREGANTDYNMATGEYMDDLTCKLGSAMGSATLMMFYGAQVLCLTIVALCV